MRGHVATFREGEWTLPPSVISGPFEAIFQRVTAFKNLVFV